MRKALTNLTSDSVVSYYNKFGNKVIIDRENRKTYPKKIKGQISDSLFGDISGITGKVGKLRGDVSDISGDVSNINGDVSDIRGDVSELRGNVSGIRGDVKFCGISGIRGDVSGLQGYVGNICGDVSGLRGDASRLVGNIDDCELTDKERNEGIDINDLVENNKEKND